MREIFQIDVYSPIRSTMNPVTSPISETTEEVSGKSAGGKPAISIRYKTGLSRTYRNSLKLRVWLTNPCSNPDRIVDEIMESSYVMVQDNRLEWNYATSCCGAISDHPRIVYFDRDVAQNAVSANWCSPAIIPSTWLPCGSNVSHETVLLYGHEGCGGCGTLARPSDTGILAYLRNMVFCCLVPRFFTLPGIDDPEKLAKYINESRYERLDRAYSVPEPMKPPILVKSPPRANKVAPMIQASLPLS